MPSLLLELFSEEIPARMQVDAARSLQRMFEASMGQANLPCSPLQTYVTPRRVALIGENIPTAQSDATTEKKGPKTSAPQAAIDGFLKSTSLTLDKLEKRMVGKDETYFAVIHQKGQPTAAVLKSIIEKILNEFPWPKSMRWGSGEARWVRPLHSVLCLFDGKTVPVEFGGVTAGNITCGHRFLAPQPIAVTTPDEYVAKLKAAKVIAGHDERKAQIVKQAEALAARHGLTIKRDEGLLSEVTGLVEWPVALMGRIDAKFMDLPAEVLSSEMRAHQKYFALLGKDSVFSDRFLIISNMETSDGGKAVVAGNERVLRARLSDGRFFFDQDRKRSLSDWAGGLSGVTFHAKIGTMAQKVDRIERLAGELCAYVKDADKPRVQQAARLCKADLTTGMVGEFPELQGVMGRYYALHQKEDAQVADAIRDHYLPLGPDSPVPTAPVSICVALADKLDTLISMFAAGEKPTGSKDPFALRRSALGIIRIILENGIRLQLRVILSVAKDLTRDSSASPQNDRITDELLTFFGDRLAVQLKDQGIRHDIIKAVMANGDDDLVRVVARAKALQEFLGTQDGANLLAAYRRAANIVSIEEKKNHIKYEELGDEYGTLDKDEYSINLSKALSEARNKIKEAQGLESFQKMSRYAANLRTPIDDFLTHVLVNTDNAELRAFRLGLLAWIRSVFNVIANFALIEG